jgi:hypothetical protein
MVAASEEERELIRGMLERHKLLSGAPTG